MSPLTYQLNRTIFHLGVQFPPNITHQMLNLKTIQNIILEVIGSFGEWAAFWPLEQVNM